jgi:hypothetical protein
MGLVGSTRIEVRAVTLVAGELRDRRTGPP